MQFLVVLAVAVACVAADVSHIVPSDESQAPIVRSNYESSPDGNFEYSYETGNGISAQANGVVLNPNSEDATLEVRGTFKYVSPDGTPIETTYFAGKNGVEFQGSHIPVAPPIPDVILRSIAWTAAQVPAYVESSKPGYVETNKPVYKP